MTDIPKPESLANLQDEIETFLRSLPGDPEHHRHTAILLAKKGYSAAEIKDFLRDNV